MDVENIKILDRAGHDLRLQYKEMLYIRKLNPSLNRQMNSELFTLIIRNLKQKKKYYKRYSKELVKSKKFVLFF
jgi:ABC-type transport system involved in cytochrome bd biosynthesis fused ATPase/permease subunit